jgi:hypothetical protein
MGQAPAAQQSDKLLSKRFDSSANIYTVGKLGFDRLFEQFIMEDMDFATKPKGTKFYSLRYS